MFQAPLTDAFVVGHPSARPVDEGASQKLPSLSANYCLKVCQGHASGHLGCLSLMRARNQIELDAGGERDQQPGTTAKHDRILYEVLVRPDDI